MNICGHKVSRIIKIQFLLVLGFSLSACNFAPVKENKSYVPASIYRNSLNTQSYYSHTSNLINNSIFRPEFINLMIDTNRNEGAIDIFRLKQSVSSWNSVATDRRDSIQFNAEHFYKMAGLGDNNTVNCSESGDCTIDLQDLKITRYWLSKTIHLKNNSINTAKLRTTQINHINADNNSSLHYALKLIDNDTMGNRLITQLTQNNTVILVKKLHGKHGYYNSNKNIIVIDPTIVSYEFNLRYLVHEMVHATNLTMDNAISEEIVAELIGFNIQNRLTGVPLAHHAYAVFIEHLLHADYGQLPMENNIFNQLSTLGIEFI